MDDLRDARHSLEGSWLAIALDALADPVITVEPMRDEAGRVVDLVYRQANAAACRYNRMSRAELLGARMLEIFPGMVEAGLFQAQVDALETGHPLAITDMLYGNEQRGGESLRYDVRAVKTGEALVVTWRDVTDRYLTTRQLRSMAETDSLTGLTSRTEGLSLLRAALRGQGRRSDGLAIAYLDIDGLKSTNDRLGHAAGDALLRSTAMRIRSSVRDSDAVIRLGGDEVLVLLHGAQSLEDAVEVCEKARIAVALPIRIDDQDASTSVSIGVTLARREDGVEDVLARADSAMYDAKSAGGNRVHVR